MTTHLWIIPITLELVVVQLLTALWPANVTATPKWECTSVGGWYFAIHGRQAFVPASDDATSLKFIPPNKMCA